MTDTPELTRQPSCVVAEPAVDEAQSSRALTFFRAINERSRLLDDLRQEMAEMKRQSTSIPSVDPAVREAIKKVNARCERIEAANSGLLEVVTDLNRKMTEFSRLLSGIASLTDGL